MLAQGTNPPPGVVPRGRGPAWAGLWGDAVMESFAKHELLLRGSGGPHSQLTSLARTQRSMTRCPILETSCQL